MIIFGTRSYPSLVSESEFYCPKCDGRRAAIQEVRAYFTLYFIPIIPLGARGRYVECRTCLGTYDEEVLTFRPVDADDQNAEKMLRVMIMAAMADDQIDPFERGAIERQYTQLAGVPLAHGTIDHEADLARQSGVDLNRYVSSFVHELSDFGKELVVKVSYGVMASSGQLTSGHKKQLTKMATTLHMDKKDFLNLLKPASHSAG